MTIDIPAQTSLERLADLLLELEAALREQQLWETKQPSLEALSSQQPFCFDTLRFTQWLQFVFVARLKDIIECCGALPTRSGIVPIAKENFKGVTYDAQQIIFVLAQFDTFIEQQSLYP